MRKIILSALILLFFGITAFSQQKELLDISNHEDCTTALDIDITQKIIGPTIPPNGYGNDLEFSGNPMKDLKYFEKEHNTVWYRFEIPFTGKLVFELVPTAPNDDYDFMLFKYNGNDFCSTIKRKILPPIRTNISRNDKKIESKTGLSYNATNAYQHSGIGTDYSQYINVRKGDIYYLLVDNVYPNGKGHTLIFDYKTEEKTIIPKAEPTVNRPKYLKDLPIIGIVKDKLTDEKLEATVHFSLIGATEPQKIVQSDSKSGKFNFKTEIDLRNHDQKKYHIKVEKEGYFSRTIALKPMNIPNFQRKPLIIKLEPINPSKQVTIVGAVKDQETAQPLKAEISFLNATTGEIIAQTFSDSITGKFELTPDINLLDTEIREFAVEIYKDGYFFASDAIPLKNLPLLDDQPFTAKISKLKAGKNFVIDNINFYGNSPKPLPRSEYVFKLLKKLMKRNKTLTIKIEGHTNGCGNGRNFSKKLSNDRCKTVVDYLVSKGIDISRLDYQGFSCDRMLYPKPKNAEEEQLNRRVEIRVISL